MKFGQNPSFGSRDRVQASFFCQNLNFLQFLQFYNVVTLNIRSRSPKSNQIFKPSQRYSIWSLARIRHLVQEIGCRQAFFFFFFLVITWKFQSADVTLKIKSRPLRLGGHYYSNIASVLINITVYSNSMGPIELLSIANFTRGGGERGDRKSLFRGSRVYVNAVSVYISFR